MDPDMVTAKQYIFHSSAYPSALILPVAQSTVSEHLRILREAGLVWGEQSAS